MQQVATRGDLVLLPLNTKQNSTSVEGRGSCSNES
jgi:hypothetical protein